jgi:hypothetical protein
MSSIRYALEKLDAAVGQLDESVVHLETAFEQQQPAQNSNVVDVDFMAQKLDRAIFAVEAILKQGAR